MLLKCELKQVKHDTNAKYKSLTRGEVKASLIASICVFPSLLILKLKLSLVFYVITYGCYAISIIALILWMRDVRKKCNTRREKCEQARC